MKQNITPPTDLDEILLDNVMEDNADQVKVGNHTYSIKWLKRGSIRKFSSVINNSEGEDDKVSCKCAAIIILNGFWKIKLLYWALWRWFYYIKQYGDAELMPVIAIGKKKIPARSYYLATTCLTVMRDTMMMMTRKEAERILQGHATEQRGKSAKAENG